MTALRLDCASGGTEQREGGSNTYQLWDVVDRSHAGTNLGRDVEMTRGGGGYTMTVAYLCNHKIAFGGWPGREGVRRVHVLGRLQRGSLRDLLLEESLDRDQKSMTETVGIIRTVLLFPSCYSSAPMRIDWH